MRLKRKKVLTDTPAHLEEHVYLRAYRHDLQCHRGHFLFVWLGHVVRETQAVYLLAGITVQVEHPAAALGATTTSYVPKPHQNIQEEEEEEPPFSP